MSRAPPERRDRDDDDREISPAVVAALRDRVDVLEGELESTRETLKDQVAITSQLREEVRHLQEGSE